MTSADLFSIPEAAVNASKYLDRLTARPSPVTVLFVIAGVWLLVSPYLLGFSGHPTATGQATVIGLAVAVLAVIRHLDRRRFEKLRWTLLVLGAWMVASPFLSEYAGVQTALWNALVAGAAILAAAVAATAVPAGDRARS